MENNNTLNIGALTPTRQELLTNALESHSVDLSSGKFTEMSQESLSKIGLTSTEINALEQANSESGLDATLTVSGSAIPSTENNPFTKDKWNPEMQRQLHETNPAAAKNLMREAGLLK